MAKEYSRSQRVGDQIQRELAALIQFEIKDPRIGMTTVTAVEVNREFDKALVYVTVMGDQEKIDSTLRGLQQAAGFLRSELAKRLKVRTTPRLEFRYDESLERGLRMSALIDQAVAKEKGRNDEDE